MSNNAKYDTELKYAQWNPFYVSLQKDIDQIKNINKILRKDTLLLPDFFSYINALFNSTKVYSEDPEGMQTKLNNVEEKIYNPRYLRDLKEQNNNNAMISYQYKMIKQLETIFSTLVKDFAENQLLPNVTKTLRKPKGRALLN